MNVSGITAADLLLINSLSARSYTDNTLLSAASEMEKTQLQFIIKKLKGLAEYFKDRYQKLYGPFETSVTTGNPLAIGGTRIKRIWSGIFKGAANKQYAAQISFVMNPKESCLDVGFYFGRASGHSFSKEQRRYFETQLHELGISLSRSIRGGDKVYEKYKSLFDFGFLAYADGKNVLPDDWVNSIGKQAKNSHIVVKIYPNDLGEIDNSSIDLYVSQVMFLMAAVTAPPTEVITIPPLSPQQRAKQAERLAEIGIKGEAFIMEKEKEKIKGFGLVHMEYPRHVALESMHYGFDIITIDEHSNEIFIEVKTTTRRKQDLEAHKFFMSCNEYRVYEKNPLRYKLCRVYNIEAEPCYEYIDLSSVTKTPDGYVITY